jgi:hypothetical protein
MGHMGRDLLRDMLQQQVKEQVRHGKDMLGQVMHDEFSG